MTQFTPQQEAFFAECTDTKNFITLSARAGTGKTTSLVEAAKRMDAKKVIGSGLAVAFNKIIAEELRERMPVSMECKTMHSLGLNLLKRSRPDTRFKVNSRKVFDIMKEISSAEWEDMAKVARVIDMLRLNLIENDDMFDKAEQFLEELGYEAHWAKLCVNTMQEMQAGIERGIVDFTDMLYGPWLFGLRPNWTFDTIMVDESQDMNALQRWLIKRHLKANGRMIICGDPRQAIMGFAGATASSMKEFEAMFKAEFSQLEISKTFRCGHAIVAEAKQAIGPTNDLDNYIAAEHMHEGQVIVLGSEQDPEMFVDGDAIVCRTNAPLLELAIWFLANDKGFKLAGKDFLKQLKSRMCRGLRDKQPVASAKRQVDEWLEARIKYAEECGRPQMADRHKDVAECCQVFLSQPDIQTVADIKAKIDLLEKDQMGPVLTSIHKSKGLEWDTVYWLGGETHLAQMAKRKEIEDPDSQEWNLRYVCATRAKQTLVKINEIDVGGV